MSYYMIHNSEDGLMIQGPFTETELQGEIGDITGPDIRPDCQAEFDTKVPNDFTDSNMYLIIKGEAVVPKPVNIVTEWEIT